MQYPRHQPTPGPAAPGAAPRKLTGQRRPTIAAARAFPQAAAVWRLPPEITARRHAVYHLPHQEAILHHPGAILPLLHPVVSAEDLPPVRQVLPAAALQEEAATAEDVNDYST